MKLKIENDKGFLNMENRPQFTREQEDWICYQIGEWYLDWKDKIVAGAALHSLGIAKEELKERLCGFTSEIKFEGSEDGE